MQLEFHLYETQWMLHRGKYKNFLAVSDKHLTQHYQQTELPGIQLQIQLIRRLLYCRLRVLRKYFIKFTTKQHKILSYLDTCMALCHMMQAHLVKCQDVLTGDSSCNRKLKLKQFSNEYASPRSGRLKQYMAEFENEPWERKSQTWYHFQEESLFIFIQEVLMYQYMYFKLTNLKEAVRFLQKLVQLKFVKVYKSILLFNEALTLLNTAYFEINYSFQNVILEPVSSMLIEAIKEYYRPKSNQAKCKHQMKQLTQLLVVNFDLQSKSLEYKDKYDTAAQVISMAQFFCQNILCFVGRQDELVNYIQNEYEYKHEKYEQVISEQHDLNQFVSFLLGTKICTYQKQPQKNPTSVKFCVESKNQYYTMRPRNEFGNSLHTPNSTPRSVIRLKKCKSPESQSYLSKLINLRNLSDHKYELQNKETGIQKHLRELMEKLHKLESPEQFRTIDEVFHNKVHQITFEKCLTLDQVKETARKIIGAEWEVHKEMPVTKSLMKLISVSDIQLEGLQQQYNKLQEYMELQKIDFHNTQKDEAQLKLKENKDLKKLQINQQKYQMKLRHQKIQQQLQIPKKLLSLQTDETGLSPKFLKRNTQIIMNNIPTTMFERLDPNERRGKEFRSAQKQLMDLMVQNLEQRDDIDNQKQRGHFVNVLPKSITRIPSPNSDCKKSFAFSSNNSTRLEITKL